MKTRAQDQLALVHQHTAKLNEILENYPKNSDRRYRTKTDLAIAIVEYKFAISEELDALNNTITDIILGRI
jgi:hypothetical protein